MSDKEKFTPEFYDKLSDSEKKEFDQFMLEEQLTDPLHIKGLPKPVQNCIKSAVKSSAEGMRGFSHPVAFDEDGYLMTSATKNFKPNQEFDRLQKIVDECISNEQYTTDSIIDYIKKDPIYLSKCKSLDRPFPVMMESDKRFIDDNVIKPVTKEIFDKFVLRGTMAYDRYGRMWIDSIPQLNPDKFYMIRPRGYGMRSFKSGLWLKYLMGYEPPSYVIYDHELIKPETKLQLDSVIHWDRSHPDYFKDIKINLNHTFYVMKKLYGISASDLIEKKCITHKKNNDKKELERVIKKGRK